MININGVEWDDLTTEDIYAVVSSVDVDESFFYEFKDDQVDHKKLTKEISAFANTYGGYIFLGIADDKTIVGCSFWTEQRIHSTIHDSITPTPQFDIKKFTLAEGTVYVIKIDEGAEPPYITNQGKIYERLSSGSFPIKDSMRLSQIYYKREQLLTRIEKKISIPPIIVSSANNLYGYIDIGFSVTLSDKHEVSSAFYKINLRELGSSEIFTSNARNLLRIGESIVYTPGGLSVQGGNDIPAHLNNFLEVMADGSAKMRLLLSNNNPNDKNVNMIVPHHIVNLYKDVYKLIMRSYYPHQFIYAKKYESLTVIKQFYPVVGYDNYMIQENPLLSEQNDKAIEMMQEKRRFLGVDVVVTDDRIPKTGLYTIDRRSLENQGFEVSADSIIDDLFCSNFLLLGFPI